LPCQWDSDIKWTTDSPIKRKDAVEGAPYSDLRPFYTEICFLNLRVFSTISRVSFSSVGGAGASGVVVAGIVLVGDGGTPFQRNCPYRRHFVWHPSRLAPLLPRRRAHFGVILYNRRTGTSCSQWQNLDFHIAKI